MHMKIIYKIKYNLPQSVSELSHNSEKSEIGVKIDLEEFFNFEYYFFSHFIQVEIIQFNIIHF